MTLTETLIAGIGSTGAVLFALNKFYKTALKPFIENVKDGMKELKSNGGSSLADKINKIATVQEEHSKSIKCISERLDQNTDICATLQGDVRKLQQSSHIKGLIEKGKHATATTAVPVNANQSSK